VNSLSASTTRSSAISRTTRNHEVFFLNGNGPVRARGYFRNIIASSLAKQYIGRRSSLLNKMYECDLYRRELPTLRHIFRIWTSCSSISPCSRCPPTQPEACVEAWASGNTIERAIPPVQGMGEHARHRHRGVVGSWSTISSYA
jgi:hypothetical protein